MRRATSWSWNDQRELTIIQRITNPEDPHYMDSFQQIVLPLHELHKLMEESTEKIKEFESNSVKLEVSIFEGVAPGGSV